MTIGLKIGATIDEIGSSEFLFAFFSTISANLEKKGWGTRFPVLLNELYSGELPSQRAGTALEELRTVRSELSAIPPDRVVWNYEDRTKGPPWGHDISSDITNMSNYFVTSGGRDLFDVLEEALEYQKGRGGVAKIVSF
ncbi:immunity 70 family protein [Oryzicola mucosus]|uniref:Immunity 70 family protein n=1 Tax=Oryzicola mucosus TaxID=2767425 RepID=A0A8J6PRC7_9HYPH|nr:immunity 70 family protein [Oryzicola mucosus]MBD0417577.1 immunity 70 family protein [Oryzicola mucosus]